MRKPTQKLKNEKKQTRHIHHQQKQEKSRSKNHFECKNESQNKEKQFMLISLESITIIRDRRSECKTKRIIAQSNEEHENAVYKLHFMDSLHEFARLFVRLFFFPALIN